MRLPAQVAVPQLAPIEVVAMNPRRAEPSDDAPTVGHGRRSAGRIVVVGRFLLSPGDAGLPEQFSRAPVKTHYRAPALRNNGLSDEDESAPHGGGGVAAFWQQHAPADVFVRAPAQRKILLGRHAASIGSAPPRPV